MIVNSIEVSASFQIHEGYWFKAHWGGTVAENEDPETETLKIKERLEDMYKKIGGTKTVAISEALPAVDPKEKWISTMIEEINQCTVITSINGHGVETGLLSYQSAANLYEPIKASYDLKMLQLKRKQ